MTIQMKMGNNIIFQSVLCCMFVSVLTGKILVLASSNDCSSNKDCIGQGEICSRSTRRCICREGSKKFAGDCLRKREHGQSCQQQYECSQSNDGHLHCIDEICQCGNQRIYDAKAKKCEVNKDKKKNQYKFKKMDPHQPRGHVKLEEKYRDISHVSQFFNSTTKHTDKKKHYEKSDPSIHTFWTVLVCLMSAFILIVCFCFCRINPNAPHSNARDKKKKNKEGAYDVKVNGHDNLGFDKERNRDPDTTSHQTTTTNVSSNCSQNTTPKRLAGTKRKNSEVKIDPSQLSVYEKVKMRKELMEKRKSISDGSNGNETSISSIKKSERRKSKNKETLKYVDKKIANDEQNTKRKSSLKTDRNTTKKTKKKEDEYTLKTKNEMSERDKNDIIKKDFTETETGAPKKKVKIKETMSQKIKKANSSSAGNKKVQNKSNPVKKETKNVEYHKKNVKLLLEQAPDATVKKSKIQDVSKEALEKVVDKELSENENKSKHLGNETSLVKDNTEAVEEPIKDSIGTSSTAQKNSNGNIRTLERVETDDCTSIDTSTLPPPPDEMDERLDDTLDNTTGERFIA